jgi:hypothetical protein
VSNSGRAIRFRPWVLDVYAVHGDAGTRLRNPGHVYVRAVVAVVIRESWVNRHVRSGGAEEVVGHREDRVGRHRILDLSAYH